VHTAAIAIFLALSFTPRQQEALHYLMTATSFESRYITEGGTRSGGYLAMRVIAHSDGADAAFKELVAHGTIAGQLYGLIGVRRTDPAFFRANIERYKNSRERVRTFEGCIIGDERVAKVVHDPKAIRLPPGTTFEAWARKHRGDETVFLDIAGGSYSCVYLDGEPTPAAERDAKAEENSYDFKRR
jgi:hypothetical protein